MNKKAVVLLSGGLDSATTLFFAKAKNYQTYCLIFDYGQRHAKEVLQAKRLARHAKSFFKVVKISLPWGGSALIDRKISLPKNRKNIPKEIPITYVPARNIIFLSFAASYAETVGAQVIFIGANAVDYSGYPDCRPNFYYAFQLAMKRGLKTGVSGKPIKIYTPLIHKTKADIIKLGRKLKVSYELTWSCYAGGQKPCGVCDSCLIRAKGFKDANIVDPL
ncbi:MAG: 7-cyano-7-deazaguanine synthase QueC [Candidatus Omnitrophica bacterium]|nr:7-cyano-7-deazaguanine synthase QueC [Candidatus Omnitrophota bacterium]